MFLTHTSYQSNVVRPQGFRNIQVYLNFFLINFVNLSHKTNLHMFYNHFFSHMFFNFNVLILRGRERH